MADLSDVENAIVSTVASAVYPNGSNGQPSVVSNDAGTALPVKIYRGWPVPAQLDTDLAAGTANISVFSRGTGTNRTKYTPIFDTVSTPTPTVSATVVDNTITITGAGSTTTQYVSVILGIWEAVSYTVTPADTPTTIAAALAALISQYVPATPAAGVVTVTSSIILKAVVGVQVAQLEEIRRQSEAIQITLWCPTPKTRDNLAVCLEPTLANTVFLPLADTSVARFRYGSTVVSDDRETVQLYRRDLFYDVEYATTIGGIAWQVTVPEVNIQSVNPATGEVAPAAKAYY